MATPKDKLIAGAQKLVEKGQFEKAIKEYLKVVATDDKDVRIWLKIGDLYAKLGKKQEASETYQKVAEFYSDQGFYLKSVAVYKQILKIDPRLIDVNQRLAELYKQLGLLSDAMSQYETVAAFFHKEGRTRDALAALKQIVELDPETVANRIKLAELYSKEQMPREAIDEFSRAAEQLKQSGRTDDYMKVAERLLFHSPDNRPVSKELAKLYIDKGDPRRALPKLQVCFKADPRDTDVLALLAKAFEALDQRAKSVSVLKELARILGENGDRNGRDDVYRKILVLAPNDPDAEAALAGKPRATAPAAPVQNQMPNFGSSWPPRNALNTTGSQPLIRDDPPVDEFDDKPGEGVTKKPPGGALTTAVGQLIDGTPSVGAQPDGEAVAKILNETDVYIKYKLYAKAIEHVQRVFEHDPKHVEAREKLKALYLSVGKRDEAILELWALAEQAEPSRKRRYLREILELDPSNVKAANQLGTDVGIKPEELDGAPPLTPPLADSAHAKELPERPGRKEGSNAEPLDVDELEELGDDEFDVADPSSKISLGLGDEDSDAGQRDELGSGARYREEPHDAAVTADGEDDLIPLVVEPVADAPIDEAPSAVEDRFGFGDEDSDAGAAVDEAAIESEIEAEQRPAAMAPTDSERHAVAAGVEAIARPSIARPSSSPSSRDRERERERARAPVEDEHEARTRFDEAPLKFLEKDGLFGGNPDEIDESELPPVENLRTPGTATVPKAAVLGDDDSPEPDDAHTANEAPSGEPATSLEDDLDEADFFVQQSLFDEARDILTGLLERHPGHPLVSAKMRDLDAMERAAAAPAAAGDHEDSADADDDHVPADAARTHDRSRPHDRAHEPAAAADDAHARAGADAAPPAHADADADADSPAHSDLSAEPPDELPGSSDAESPAADGLAGDPVYEVTRRGVIEKGVTAEDFETHYDLGIAYKEMGLLDDAIAEFKLVMKDPAREVQCHLMIGLCCLEKGLQTEAIGHFKKGLYVEGITERESLSLYFELGQAYERLGDPREALYYYEKVVKRDARFRNVEKLVELLRGGATQATAAPATPGGDDVDAAFDTLLDGNGT